MQQPKLNARIFKSGTFGTFESGVFKNMLPKPYKSSTCVTFLGLFLLLSGCGALQNAKEQVLSKTLEFIPVEIDKNLGNAAWPTLQGRILKDVDLQSFVSPLFKHLPRHSPHEFDWRIGVIADASTNAFAMPGGVVVFHSGLILKATSAEEVMGVMAHEIGHVALRHGVRAMVQDRVVSLIFGLLSSVIIGDVGGIAGIITGGAAQLTSLKFSRDQERQADAFAVELLQSANISPRGMASFFAKLAKRPEVDGKANDTQQTSDGLKKALSWISTHPMPEERASALQELLKKSPTKEESAQKKENFLALQKNVREKLSNFAENSRGN